MNDLPLVSIICLCYNHAAFVREALDSVAAQTYPNIEIIIVDDNSSDDSKNVISEWISENQKGHFIANSSNIGNTKSFNKALQLSKGDYIIDFATDDVLLSECISELLSRFQNSDNENLGVVYCNAERIDENGKNIGYFFPVNENKKAIFPIPTGNVYQKIVGSGSYVCAVAMMVKRNVHEKLHGYDESLAYEDLDFWIRSSRDFDFDYVDAILCKKRMLSTSLGHFYKKFLNKRAFEINLSTYKILKSTFEKTNKTRAEDLALLQRIHYEIVLVMKNGNFPLLIPYAILELRLRLKRNYKSVIS